MALRQLRHAERGDSRVTRPGSTASNRASPQPVRSAISREAAVGWPRLEALRQGVGANRDIRVVSMPVSCLAVFESLDHRGVCWNGIGRQCIHSLSKRFDAWSADAGQRCPRPSGSPSLGGEDGACGSTHVVDPRDASVPTSRRPASGAAGSGLPPGRYGVGMPTARRAGGSPSGPGGQRMPGSPARPSKCRGPAQPMVSTRPPARTPGTGRPAQVARSEAEARSYLWCPTGSGPGGACHCPADEPGSRTAASRTGHRHLETGQRRAAPSRPRTPRLITPPLTPRNTG
jgi:hypothetical protein